MQNNVKNADFANEVITFSFEGKPIRVIVLQHEFIWYVLGDILAIAPMPIPDLPAECKMENFFATNTETLINVWGLGAVMSEVSKNGAVNFVHWIQDNTLESSLTKLRQKAQVSCQVAPLQARATQNLPAPTASVDLDMQVLTFEGKHEIRFFFDDNRSAWFVASDICKVLGWSNTRQTIDDNCDRDGVSKKYIIDKIGRKQEVTILDESNVKRLTSNSKKPEAKRLEAWIFEEVLPALSKEIEVQITDFQVFIFRNNEKIRVWVDEKGNYWFAGVDVCNTLTYANSRKAIEDHCKKDGVTKRYTIDNLNRKKEILFINEPNLYRLIVKSEKPEAEVFEKWVFEEVLPTLRKTGKYEMPSMRREREEALERERWIFNLLQEYGERLKYLERLLAESKFVTEEKLTQIVDSLMQSLGNFVQEHIEEDMKALKQSVKLLWNTLNKITQTVEEEVIEVVRFYLIQQGDSDWYKLGISVNPLARAGELSTGNSQELGLVFELAFYSRRLALSFERHLEEVFQHKPKKGEWRKLDAKDLLFVERLGALWLEFQQPV